MPRNARLNQIKAFRCYTLQEAADVCGVSLRTVRNWIAKGLLVMNDERPALIRGDDLLAFLKAERAERKHHLAPDRFFCLRCRGPRAPAEGIVECQPRAKGLALVAICEVCETVCFKSISRSDLPDYRKLFDLEDADI
jgi:hypothetical protein